MYPITFTIVLFSLKVNYYFIFFKGGTDVRFILRYNPISHKEVEHNFYIIGFEIILDF